MTTTWTAVEERIAWTATEDPSYQFVTLRPTTVTLTSGGGGGGAVDSVNGQTGVVVLDAGDVGADPAGTAAGLVDDLSGVTNAATARTNLGLGNVDNTSDANKPVSTAQQTALDGKAAASHSHSGADITSGTVSTARLGTGAANATTFLRGDQTWAAAGGSETLPASIIDAKGDLIVGTADNTVARLPVGSNGRVLTADSAQASGVKWAAAPYVWAMELPFSGYWVGVSGKTAATSDATTSLSAAGRMAYVPCALISGTYDRLGVLIGTGAASTLRLGLYSVGSNGKPDQLVLDAGTVSGATPGMAAATIAPTTLAGPYWAAVLVETYAPGLLMYCYGTDEPAPFQAVTVVSVNGRTQRAQTVSGVGSGGLPVSAPPVNMSGNYSSPMVIARVA